MKEVLNDRQRPSPMQTGRTVKARAVVLCGLALVALWWPDLPPTQAVTPKAAQDPQAVLEGVFRPGQSLLIEGQQLLCQKVTGGKLILAPPTPPTALLGDFIAPVDVTASSAQEGRVARKMIDSSGWGESSPGSGVFVHSNNVYEGGTVKTSVPTYGETGDPRSALGSSLGHDAGVRMGELVGGIDRHVLIPALVLLRPVLINWRIHGV